MPQWLVIGVSGVTCGGKTTLSHNLRDFFQSKQNMQLWQTPYIIGDVQLISQDDYFLPVDDRRHKWIDPINAINFELLTSLDMKQMLSDITWTMKGRYLVSVGDPTALENNDYMNDITMEQSYDNFGAAQLMPPPPVPPSIQQHYHNHKVQQQQQQHHHHYHNSGNFYLSHHNYHHQQQQQQHRHQHQQQHQRNAMRINHHHHHHNHHQSMMKLRDNKINVLIIEGFIIFNQPELISLCNLKFHFHLPYEKCFERRQSRTYEPPDVTGYFEMCVWPYYERNFAEYRDRTDIIFLNGEISKERICDFAIKKIKKYVEERCNDVLMNSAIITTTTTTTSSTTAPPPHKMIGIHNGSNSAATPCPMEQQ